ncbi:hypothetical protein Pogu_1731 [Pyrobaculum oguniense TE7]|uniref:Uncharacterized protein n=1 Tax=Pyrobaculum oguniense (strain DSM 13380 / JCM 10595 / TE7) TaxID=698757 RepID=H6QCE4_PYROT|nr:hypothetical protein Pogu_1731 [Pyrobaculum oguniense TE7]
MRRLLSAMLFLLAAGYVGINIVGLPPLLVAENLVLATVYASLGAATLLRYGKTALLATTLIAAFNAGRVSRSVWSPTTGFGPLAAEHAPLLLYLIAVAALAAALLLREK